MTFVISLCRIILIIKSTSSVYAAISDDKYSSVCSGYLIGLNTGLNTLRPRQIGRHFPDDIFEWIFLKMYEFRLTFHWNLFLGVQLTIIQHWFRLSESMVVKSPTHICVTRPQWVKAASQSEVFDWWYRTMKTYQVRWYEYWNRLELVCCVYLWVHNISVVLWNGLHPLWLTERYFSIFSLDLHNVNRNNDFSYGVQCHMSWLFSWSSSFPGCRVCSCFHYLLPGGSCDFNISFIMCAPYSCISLGLYFSNSPGVSCSSVAILLLSLVKVFADVISSFNGLGSLINGYIISASSFETSFRRIQLFILRCHYVLLLMFLYHHLLSHFEIDFCIKPLQHILDPWYFVYFTCLSVDFPFPILL